MLCVACELVESRVIAADVSVGLLGRSSGPDLGGFFISLVLVVLGLRARAFFWVSAALDLVLLPIPLGVLEALLGPASADNDDALGYGPRGEKDALHGV